MNTLDQREFFILFEHPRVHKPIENLLLIASPVQSIYKNIYTICLEYDRVHWTYDKKLAQSKPI